MLDQKILLELKIALENEKKLLIEELKTIAKPDQKLKGDWDTTHTEFSDQEIDSPENLESGEAADEVEEDEKNEAIVQNLELRLQEVNKALERMENGTYGIDEKTGKPISIERLRANPAAKMDLEHTK